MPQSKLQKNSGQTKYFWEITETTDSQGRVNYARLLKLYFLPLFTILIFLSLLFGLTLPALTSVFTSLDSIDLKTQDIATKDSTLKTLAKLAENYETLTNQVASLNLLVPSGTSEIAKFQAQLISLAQQEGLTLKGEPSTGEQIVSFRGSANNLELLEIPAIFNLGGNLTQIRSFISKIQSLDSFLIIGEMALRSDSGNNWSLKLTLYKYQFPEKPSEKQLGDYLNVPLNAKYNKDVLNLLNKSQSF